MSNAEFPSVLGTLISFAGKGVEVFQNLREVFIGGVSIGTSVSPGEFQVVFDAIEHAVQERLRLEELFAETGELAILDEIQALGEGVRDLLGGISVAVETKTVSALPDATSIKAMSEQAITPPRPLTDPCVAPASALRDLLDLGLARIEGALGFPVRDVVNSILSLLTPAAATGENLNRFVESILADPVTALLNLVRGQESQVRCLVEAHLGVGAGVIETQIRRLQAVLAEVLA